MCGKWLVRPILGHANCWIVGQVISLFRAHYAYDSDIYIIAVHLFKDRRSYMMVLDIDTDAEECLYLRPFIACNRSRLHGH